MGKVEVKVVTGILPALHRKGFGLADARDYAIQAVGVARELIGAVLFVQLVATVICCRSGVSRHDEEAHFLVVLSGEDP